MSFDQKKYWIDRHERHVGDPRSVGTFARSVEENLHGERELQEVVREAARLLRPARTVLDLGCGYGRVAGSFVEEGYSYTGVDLSPEAIAAARQRVPRAEFICAALDEWRPQSKADVVSVLYVFVHFVDDAAWEAFFNNALSWVADGGALLFADEFPKERTAYGQHVVCRPISEYAAILSEAGFALDESFSNELQKAAPYGQATHCRLARHVRR